MYFIWDFTQLNVRPHSRVGLLKYKTAPKCSLSGPFRIGPIPSFRRRPESRRAPIPSFRRRPESRRAPIPSFRRRPESKRAPIPSFRRRPESRRAPIPSFRRRPESRRAPIPSFRRRPESRRAHSVIPAQAGIQGRWGRFVAIISILHTLVSRMGGDWSERRSRYPSRPNLPSWRTDS